MMATTETRTEVWSNVYGLARSLLALSTLTTLVLHSPTHLFRPYGTEMSEVGASQPVGLSLFHLLPLNVTVGVAIAVLIAVVSGWRPRITGILHWYVSASFAASTFVIEGGDQVASVLSLFLIPVTLLDSRKWHWQNRPVPKEPSLRNELANVVARGVFTLIRLQVCVIYLDASIGKMRSPVWQNGTGLYYWLQVPVFGPPAPIQSLAVYALSFAAPVVLATWGVVLFELAMAGALVASDRYRRNCFVLAIAFHSTIVVLHGLGTFFLSMAAAVILYLRAPDQPFKVAETWLVLRGWLTTTWAALGRLQTLGKQPKTVN